MEAGLGGDELEGALGLVIAGTVHTTLVCGGRLRAGQRLVFAPKMPVGFVLVGRDAPDRPEQSSVVPPVHPPAGGQLDVFHGAPRPLAGAVDDFGFVQAIDGLGQGVVIAVAPGADRDDRSLLGETFGVANGQVLTGLNRS